MLSPSVSLSAPSGAALKPGGGRGAAGARGSAGPEGQRTRRGPRAGQSGGGERPPPPPRRAPGAEHAEHERGRRLEMAVGAKGGGWEGRGAASRCRPQPGCGVASRARPSRGAGRQGGGAPLGEGVARWMNKGDGRGQRRHCRAADTLPKMAPGAGGRGFRWHRPPRGGASARAGPGRAGPGCRRRLVPMAAAPEPKEPGQKVTWGRGRAGSGARAGASEGHPRPSTCRWLPCRPGRNLFVPPAPLVFLSSFRHR